ncbi:MAG: hypothetical protein E7294_05865 [Lachnospiraceae bacterium]|jgi:hypothetical protein|nr:hypothetical protein [Lachnospiraceae bacterium]
MKLAELSLLEKTIEEAEFVLVGLGEEWWVQPDEIKKIEKYRLLYERLEKAGQLERGIPFWIALYYENEIPHKLAFAYQNLHTLLKNKNYFIVSKTLDPYLKKYGFIEEKYVNPCGNHEFLQCTEKCGSRLVAVKEMIADLEEYLNKICENEGLENKCKCIDCGSRLVFNNIYAEKYSQAGYEKKWEIYMKWLQGTVNKKLAVLELGVGMNFPTVIRWPFEKTVLYNQKSTFFRINETLSMLTPEISERGYSRSENSVDTILACKKNNISL